MNGLSRLLLLLCAVFLAAEALAENGLPDVDELPPYPRHILGELYSRATRDPAGLSDPSLAMPREGVVVLGRVVKAATAGTDHDLLVDDVMACCVSHSVAFRLAEGNELKDGAWLAVYGQVVESELPAATGRAPWSALRAIYVAGGYQIQVERVVPAELLMYPDNVVDLLESNSIELFERALRVTELDQRLRVAEAVTLLVPVDATIEGLPEDERRALLEGTDREALGRFVLAHVIPERLLEADFYGRSAVTTMDGAQVRVTVVNGGPRIGASRILFGNKVGSNGVVHMIAPPLPVQQLPGGPAADVDPFDPLQLPPSPHPEQ